MSRSRRTIVVGSSNPGKLAEIQTLLGSLPVELRSLSAYPDAQPPEETGATFAENARLKATTLARQLGTWVLAEDSGLCVDALDGRPGVRSARYGGPDATDAQRVVKLLEELRDVPEADRGAAFVSVAALASPERVLLEAEGACRGRITGEPLGETGFGYDPVFFYPDFGATFAQAGEEAKNRVSHRGRALRTLAERLVRLLASDD